MRLTRRQIVGKRDILREDVQNTPGVVAYLVPRGSGKPPKIQENRYEASETRAISHLSGETLVKGLPGSPIIRELAKVTQSGQEWHNVCLFDPSRLFGAVLEYATNDPCGKLGPICIPSEPEQIVSDSASQIEMRALQLDGEGSTAVS